MSVLNEVKLSQSLAAGSEGEIKFSDFWKEQGRLGQRKVILDKESSFGEFNFNFQTYDYESKSQFSSIRANVAVFEGK